MVKELNKERNIEAFNKLIEKIRCNIVYQAYGSGAILAFLKDYGIKAFIPLFTTRSGNNNCSDFEGIAFDPTKQTYVCSNSVSSHVSKVNSDEIVTYCTRIKDCRNCTLSDTCQAPIIKGRDVRVISRHIHDDLFKK